MGYEDLRGLTEAQQQQLDSIIISIQMSNAIPETDKSRIIQEATKNFINNLRQKGELKTPEAKRAGAFDGLLEIKPYPVKSFQMPYNRTAKAYSGRYLGGPIMLH